VKGLILLAGLATFAVATPAFGHAHLSKSVPAAGATGASPPEIVLSFTEPLEAAFSRIEIRDATGKSVEIGNTQVKDATMRVPLKSLPPGTYKVNWRVLSVDTHKSEGNFMFTVKP